MHWANTKLGQSIPTNVTLRVNSRPITEKISANPVFQISV